MAATVKAIVKKSAVWSHHGKRPSLTGYLLQQQRERIKSPKEPMHSSVKELFAKKA